MIAVRQVLATAAVLAVTTRIRQDSANPDEIAPYVVWRRLAVVPENNLSDAPPGDRESITVDVFTPDTSEKMRDDLTIAVRDALEARGHVTSMQSLGHEADTKLYRFSIDADLFVAR